MTHIYGECVLHKVVSDESRACSDRLVLDNLLSDVDTQVKQFFRDCPEGGNCKLRLVITIEKP